MTEPSDLTAPFWTAAAEHRLVIPRCNRTGVYFFPPERCVPGSDNTDWEYVECSGRATVYTYSVVHRPVSADFEVPYILAVVDLEEGVAMMTNVVSCRSDEIGVGLPVEVKFTEVVGGCLPVFAPARSEPPKH